MSCFVAFHYRSYGTFFLQQNRLHNIHRGFTHYKYYRADLFITIKMQECYNLLRQDKKEGIELASQILSYLDSRNALFLDQAYFNIRDTFYQQVKMLNKTGIDLP